MGMREKLKAAATQAAIEATTNERARCLWCADQVVIEVRKKLEGKVLTSIQFQASQLKLKIADAVVRQLRRAIVSGVRPQGGLGGTTGTADLSTPVDHGDVEESDDA